MDKLKTSCGLTSFANQANFHGSYVRDLPNILFACGGWACTTIAIYFLIVGALRCRKLIRNDLGCCMCWLMGFYFARRMSGKEQAQIGPNLEGRLDLLIDIV